ncbi:MAG: phosphotransferase [Alphaproteobacteria bacterium]
MAHALNLPALLAALYRHGGYDDVSLHDLVPLAGTGIAHDHVRIAGTRHLLRLPRLSQFGLTPHDNLIYQAACFERAAASGHAPRLHGVLPPAGDMPMGGLIVDYIDGRPVRLDTDMPAIAECLAALHCLPVPVMAARAPLASHDDPVAATMSVIRRQASDLGDAGVSRQAQAHLTSELAWASRFAETCAGKQQPVTLVATDTHPGNYVMHSDVPQGDVSQGDSQAFIVDLEKALYGAPAIDLAHATLYTSTTWAGGPNAFLSTDQTQQFYRHYMTRLPAGLARAIRPWCLPLRRLTWLRTTTWAASWSVRRAADDPAATPDALAQVADFLSAPRIAAIRSEWLEDRLADLV